MPTFLSHLSSAELVTGVAEQLCDRVENPPSISQKKKKNQTKKSFSLASTSFKAKPAIAELWITGFNTDIYSFSGPTSHLFQEHLKSSSAASYLYFYFLSWHLDTSQEKEREAALPWVRHKWKKYFCFNICVCYSFLFSSINPGEKGRGKNKAKGTERRDWVIQTSRWKCSARKQSF